MKEVTPLPSGELTVGMAEQNLHRLFAQLEAALEAAAVPVATIDELAGPSPAALPAMLKTTVLQGIGYIRHARDCITVVFSERNRLRAEHEQSTRPEKRGESIGRANNETL